MTFEPVILKNVCSKTYLDMFMHMIPSVELWENTEENDVNYQKINLTKLNVVTHGKYDSPLLTLLITGMVGAVIVSIVIPFYWVKPTLNQWSLMAGIGVFACIGHLFLILSLKYADASKLAPLGYTEIIPNVLIGYYFFSDLPDNWTYLGLFIIVLSGLYISRREYYLNKLR